MKVSRALAAVALLLVTCRQQQQQDVQREAALRDTLSVMRRAIANYKADTGQYPRSLQDLVPKYIRKIPPDPITTSTTTWRLTTEETVQPSTDFATSTAPAPVTVIIDVHSGAPGADGNGVLYSNY